MMTTLWLTEPLARQIAEYTRQARPNEACGLIAGRDGRAELVIAVPNIAADPRYHYDMDPQALVKAMFQIQHHGLDLIGIYHSHPTGDPIPSRTDIARAAYPDAAYVIVGWREDETQFAAWRIHRHEVTPLALHIGPQPPQTSPAELSNSHKFAIIVSAVLAFVFMMILSLSLLPPAPQIP